MPLPSIPARSKLPLALVLILLVAGALTRTATGQPQGSLAAHSIFKVAGAMITPRQEHTATLLTNGMVLITGGMNAGKHTIASAELFNPATGRFSPTAERFTAMKKFMLTGSMATARTFHSASLLNSGALSGQVLMAGGFRTGPLATAEIFNPSRALSKPRAT
jgi:hypothetical protein